MTNNFKKDINVPSKEIEYKEDAKDCELAKSGSCCYCKNMACYQLEQQLKAKEQECERLKNKCNEWMSKCEQETKLKEFFNEQLEAYKMEAEEGKEINAELKEKLQNTTTSLYAHIGNFDKLTKEHVYLENKYRKEIDKQRKSIERYKAENERLKFRVSWFK